MTILPPAIFSPIYTVGQIRMKLRTQVIKTMISLSGEGELIPDTYFSVHFLLALGIAMFSLVVGDCNT